MFGLYFSIITSFITFFLFSISNKIKAGNLFQNVKFRFKTYMYLGFPKPMTLKFKVLILKFEVAIFELREFIKKKSFEM